jgi:hypothetical protein
MAVPVMKPSEFDRRCGAAYWESADACNIPPTPELSSKLELRKRLCDEAGRDYDVIAKTAPFAFDVGLEGWKVPELLGRLRWLGSLGVQTVLGWVVGLEDIQPIAVMGREVIPAVAEL